MNVLKSGPNQSQQLWLLSFVTNLIPAEHGGKNRVLFEIKHNIRKWIFILHISSQIPVLALLGKALRYRVKHYQRCPQRNVTARINEPVLPELGEEGWD